VHVRSSVRGQRANINQWSQEWNQGGRVVPHNAATGGERERERETERERESVARNVYLVFGGCAVRWRAHARDLRARTWTHAAHLHGGRAHPVGTPHSTPTSTPPHLTRECSEQRRPVASGSVAAPLLPVDERSSACASVRVRHRRAGRAGCACVRMCVGGEQSERACPGGGARD